MSKKHTFEDEDAARSFLELGGYKIDSDQVITYNGDISDMEREALDYLEQFGYEFIFE